MGLDAERERALDMALAQIERSFGKGSIMRLGEASDRLAIEVIPTGAIALDLALGVGGIPRGRVTEIFGPESSGKTTLLQHIIGQAHRKLTGAISRSRTSVIFTNQLREKIGVMFGNPETTPGGRSLKFYASVRLDIRRIDSIKQGTTVIGNRTRVRVVKNKVAPPFRTAEFDIMYNEGISREGSILDVATDLEIIRKSGAFFSYGDTRLGQGRENAKDYLRRNRELTDTVERQVRQVAAGTMPLEVAVGDGIAEDEGEFALQN